MKNYRCEECDIRFSTSSSLKRHVEVKHKGIRQSSVRCDYKTTQSVNLSRHLETRNYSRDDGDNKFSQAQSWALADFFVDLRTSGLPQPKFGHASKQPANYKFESGSPHPELNLYKCRLRINLEINSKINSKIIDLGN